MYQQHSKELKEKKEAISYIIFFQGVKVSNAIYKWTSCPIIVVNIYKQSVIVFIAYKDNNLFFIHLLSS